MKGLCGGFWYTEAELMNTYWRVLPRNREISRSTSACWKAIQFTTASQAVPAVRDATAVGSWMSAFSIRAPGIEAPRVPRVSRCSS